MPTIRVRNNGIAAGARVFPLQGSQYEYLPFDALVEFAVVERTATARGATATIYSGTDILQQNAQIEPKASPIQYPYDFLVSDAAGAGERLSVEVENPGGAAGTADVETVVRITPL